MQQKKYVLSRLAGVTILIYLIGGVVSGYLAFLVIDKSMLEQSDRSLAAILNSRATLVEDYFHVNQQQVSYLSQNAMLIKATTAFTAGFSSLRQDIELTQSARSDIDGELEMFYVDDFSPTIEGNGTNTPLTRPTLPQSEAGRLAQWIYIVNNPNPTGSKNELFTSSYDSSYERVHRSFHPRLNHFLKSFDFRDVFLLDLSGNLVYSTQKEVDFATNVMTGPYSKSGLGRAYRGAMASEVRDVVTVDFEAYVPSYLEPAAFIAAPVFDNAQRIGAVVFQMDPHKLNEVISDLHGFGDTTETYIVGDDFLMRTDSRFSDTSTILHQEVDTYAARESLRGHSGSAVIEDYRGISVLSHYRPLRIDGLDWGIIAEIDEADVTAPAVALARNTLAVFIVTLGIIAFVSVMTLRLCVVRPLSQLLNSAKQIINGNYSTRVHVASKDEFAILAESHNQMAKAVQGHIAALESTLAEVKELQGLLPICASCKSIRDDDGYFKTVETYLVGKSKIQFSHTICHDCIPLLYPELSDTLNK